MLYPPNRNAQKGKRLSNWLFTVSVIIAALSLTINILTTPDLNWGMLVCLGILYIWITIWYFLKSRRNLAGHILIQTIAVSTLTVGIDYFIGYKGWSLSIAIPIILITANTVMLLLAIVSRKKYLSYVIDQFFIIIISMIPIFFLTKHMLSNPILTYISIGISILNFVVTSVLCQKEIREEFKRKLHI